jgi:hypothetical protein
MSGKAVRVMLASPYTGLETTGVEPRGAADPTSVL